MDFGISKLCFIFRSDQFTTIFEIMQVFDSQVDQIHGLQETYCPGIHMQNFSNKY